MSKVVRVVGGVVGTVVGIVIREPNLIMASVALLLGGAQEMLLKKPRISQPGDPFRDISANVSDPVGALPVIYGNQTVGVNRVWARTEDETVDGVVTTNRFLYVLCAVCHGPVSEMMIVYLDGVHGLIRSITSPNRFVNAPLGGGINWFDMAHAQWASGTDGQLAVIPNTSPRTITSLTRAVSSDLLTLTTSAAHAFESGDVLRVTGNSVAGYNLPGGYTVNSVPTSTTALLTPRSGQPTGTGTGGTVDFYNIDPTALAN